MIVIYEADDDVADRVAAESQKNSHEFKVGRFVFTGYSIREVTGGMHAEICAINALVVLIARLENQRARVSSRLELLAELPKVHL